MYCSKCGFKNKDDAKFCSKCGFSFIDEENGRKLGDDINTQFEKVGKKVDRVARNFGDAADRFGKRIEDRFDRAGKGFELWYDSRFGIVGSLVWSFLGIIILRIIIEALVVSGLTTLVNIGDFLYEYLLLLFGVMLISNYNTYFNRKYKKNYRWFYPTVSTVSFIVCLWVVANIFIILDLPIFSAIASFIETYLVAIFIIILIFSYGFVMVVQPFIKEKK